jgi:hypothetical protein
MAEEVYYLWSGTWLKGLLTISCVKVLPTMEEVKAEEVLPTLEWTMAEEILLNLGWVMAKEVLLTLEWGYMVEEHLRCRKLCLKAGYLVISVLNYGEGVCADPGKRDATLGVGGPGPRGKSSEQQLVLDSGGGKT